jgi:hypothetical protein
MSTSSPPLALPRELLQRRLIAAVVAKSGNWLPLAPPVAAKLPDLEVFEYERPVATPSSAARASKRRAVLPAGLGGVECACAAVAAAAAATVRSQPLGTIPVSRSSLASHALAESARCLAASEATLPARLLRRCSSSCCKSGPCRPGWHGACGTSAGAGTGGGAAPRRCTCCCCCCCCCSESSFPGDDFGESLPSAAAAAWGIKLALRVGACPPGDKGSARSDTPPADGDTGRPSPVHAAVPSRPAEGDIARAAAGSACVGPTRGEVG